MATKRKKKISLAEFHAWLEGVEELQPEGWSPSLDQWKLIRSKIDSVKETEPPKHHQQPQQSPQVGVAPPAAQWPQSTGGLPPLGPSVGGGGESNTHGVVNGSQTNLNSTEPEHQDGPYNSKFT